MLEISYKKILSIAVPLMFGTLVQSIVMLTDTAFVGMLNNTHVFNAVNNAGLIYVSLFMFSKGLADGAQILIARKYGEQNNQAIGGLIFHTQLLQLFLSSLLFSVFFFGSTWFVETVVKSQETGEQMILFLKYRSWGIFFAAMHASLAGFFIGIGLTRVVLVSSLVMALSNIALDYGLIFGKLGLPELGMIGAPIASSIAEVLAFLVLALALVRRSEFKSFEIKFIKTIQRSEIITLLKLGVPLMFQGFFALFGWLIFFMLIEREMTEHDLEVSSVIRNIYFIAFIPSFGFGSTARTYVSNLIGQNKPHLIPVVQRKIMLLSFFSILIFCSGPVFLPDLCIPMINSNPAILHDTKLVLWLVCGSIVMFSFITVLFNSVAALGKSNISFLIEMAAILIYLVCCYLFIITWRFDILGIWTVEYVYFGVLGILSYAYLIHYQKKYVTL